MNAPHLFGHEIGVNVPAFLIALVITAILVIGIKESARFNATIVTIKVGSCAFCDRARYPLHQRRQLGHGLGTVFAPFGFSGIGAGAAYIFFAYIGFDAVSTTAQEAKNPQRDLPIGIIASLLICTVLYIAVSAVLTGMVPWREVNIEAPVARAFLDRGLIGSIRHHYARSAGRSYERDAGHASGADASLVFDGQRRPFAQEILRRHSPALPHAMEEHHARRMLAAIVGSLTPIDDIGKMVNIGTLLAFVIVCIAVMALRHTNPDQPRPFRTPWVPFVPVMGILFNGYMMYKLGWINWARLIIWLVIGLVVYFTYSRKHSRVQAALEGRKTPV